MDGPNATDGHRTLDARLSDVEASVAALAWERAARRAVADLIIAYLDAHPVPPNATDAGLYRRWAEDLRNG